MKAVVTGGAGFIGSHLVEKLLSDGHEVTVIDDLSTGTKDNLSRVKDNAHLEFVHEDIRNSQTMHILVEKCDVVYHLAAAVGVQLIVDQPVRTIKTNIHGTEVVLEVAHKFGKKVLLASTSEVYGKSDAVPFKEDDDTVLGSTRFSRWSYACSKAIDEFLGLAYYQQYGLPVIIARFFNTVGPRQTGRYGMVIPRFVECALRNAPIQIYGTGKQTRCFACVDDVVRGIVDLMNCPKAPGQVYNIGSTEEVSIDALADRIIEMTNSNSVKQYLSYEEAYGKPFDDMLRRVPCLDRISRTIGYKPKMSLEQTLGLIIDDIRERIASAD